MKTYLWTVVVFIIAKIGFMFFCREGHGFSVADVMQVITHGLSLDLSTALYFLIVPFLLTMASIWVRVPRWLYNAYYAVIAVAFALAFVADTSLYPFWGFKLDASCLQYLSTPNEAAASVSTGYLLVRLVILVILVILVYQGYTRPHIQFQPSRHRLTETVFYLFCIPLMVIGIRGGVDESTTNIGQVYFSQNQFLNHSAVNPVFNFFYSLSHQLSNDNDYRFTEPSECAELVKDIYTTESIGTDTLLNTTRPNIVIILLESCGEQFATVMPRLQQLKQEGIWFSQCYGNSWRTDRGTVCTLSGYPSFPSLSVMKMPEKSRSLPSIASRLQKEGYQTSFLYGGDINFTNMRSYLIATGWEKLTWKNDYSREEQKTSEWGVRDDITFQTLFNQICASDTTRRFLIGYSTLSSHEPWQVPMHRLDDNQRNSFAYTDSCIGALVAQLKSTPQWDSLLVVIVPDHGIPYDEVRSSADARVAHIPILWVGGALAKATSVDCLMNQTDLAATLLAQMHLDISSFTFSRNVLGTGYGSRRPFALHSDKNHVNLITPDTVYSYDCVSRTLQPESSEKQDFVEAVLQSLYHTSADLPLRGR